MARPRVVNWNGKDFPPELHELPAGRYIIEPIDAVPELSLDEGAGLEEGLEEIARGETLSAEEVHASLDELAKKR